MNLFLRSAATAILSCEAVSAAPAYEAIGAFERVPAGATAGLVRHADGSFYGVSRFGGASGNGTLFRLTPAGVLSTVVHFTGRLGGAPGTQPAAELLADSDGGLMGSAASGGTGNFGTVYRVDPAAGTIQTIVEFTGTAGAARGSIPLGRLLRDPSGDIWGTTYEGGMNNMGTVFRISANAGALSTVVDFTGLAGAAKGQGPHAGLVPDGLGFYWGSTEWGGVGIAPGNGTIFKLNAATGALTTAVQFTGTVAPAAGSRPNGELLQGPAGFWWGATQSGGSGDWGTIFKVNPSTNAVTSVQTFVSGASPQFPYAGLVSDGAGFLWATSSWGGTGGKGTVFKVNVTTGVRTTLVSFTGKSGAAPGSYPQCRLVNDGAGYMWGTAFSGGSYDFGTVFKVNISTGVLTTITELNNIPGAMPGYTPWAGLVSDGANNLWGTTKDGGAIAAGTVFKIQESTGAMSTVREFSNVTGGRYPYGNLASDGAGFLWGTTSWGGANDHGTVVKIEAATGLMTTVADFSGNFGSRKGSRPWGTLVRDAAGFMWGTTSETTAGSPDNHGTVFKINASTGAFTSIARFTGTTGATKGSRPHAGLISDGTGSLWGTTRKGGAGDFGTVFKIDSTSGALATVAEFTGTGGTVTGREPYGTLMRDDDGKLWGTTVAGGAADLGTVFKMDPATGALVTTVEFTGLAGGFAGSEPYAGLVKGSDGRIWGTTQKGGSANAGTLFQIKRDGAFTTVFSFTGTAGEFPGQYPGTGPLLLRPDGSFWGTTTEGGITSSGRVAGGGQVYRFVPEPPGFADWTDNHGLSGPDAEPAADPDRDGMGNVMEFVLGGNPRSAIASLQQVHAGKGGMTVLTFHRSDESEVAGTSVRVEASPDLVGWTPAWEIGATTSASSSGVTVEENGAALDTISVCIGRGDSTRLFARIVATMPDGP